MSLDEQDKQWLREQLQTTLPEFRSSEQQWTSEQLERLETRLLSFFQSEERQWTSERLERLETRLLTEFQKWASPVEARLRTHAAAMRALDLEMEAMDDRVKKLEGGPPLENPRQ